MVCPKCGTPIKRFDLSPNCKNCGVNILYYTQEEDLARDAKRTELEFAVARGVAAKLKAAFIGSKFAIMRLVAVILSLGALAIPFLSIRITLPMAEKTLSTGIVGLVGLFTKEDTTGIINLVKIEVFDKVRLFGSVHFITFILTALTAVIIFATYLFAAINPKKNAVSLKRLSVICLIFEIIAIVTAFICCCETKNSVAVTASFCPYFFASPILIIAFIIINSLYIKSDPQIIISETDKARAELYKEVKAGKVSLDDLPLPIFETEDEKNKRLNLFGASEEGDE